MSEIENESAFNFTGSWKEFAPIAFTNLLLTIVTLGIYRFWATTRVRHYLWSKSVFIDEPLQWTGTGKELLIGFLLALIVFGLPFLAIQYGLQALVLRGYVAAAAVSGFVLYFGLLYLLGLARFRALRYRLSRTWWRGIRGGSNDNGLAYGWSYVWKTLIGGFALGLLIPWSMTDLWNQRWRAMSFGSQPIESASRPGPIMSRFLLFYLVPFAAFIVAGAAIGATLASGRPSAGLGATIFALVLLFYVALPLIGLAFYAAFFRNALGHMEWAGLQFGFDARTKDWLKLFLGSVGLVIVTLGVGLIFLQYRNWSFFMRHLQAYGEIDLHDLEQSTTHAPTQGEGLLDALDVGAI